MKKILIFYASFGGGHLSAAKALTTYIEEQYNNTKIEVELIDCVKYINKTFDKISTTAYKEMAKKAPWVWGKLYHDSKKGTLAHISSRANSFMAIKLLKLLIEKKPDIIISTHFFGSQMCTYLKGKGKIDCTIATILTDFKSHEQWLIGAENADFFFVSNENMKQELIEKNIDSNKIFVTGIPVKKEFFQEHNKKEILQELNFTENKKIILFFGGGEFGLGKTETLKAFSCLVKNFPNTQILAISGKNKYFIENFTQIVLENNRTADVKIFEFTDKIADFMSIADIVITKPGGLTVSECLVSGVPMVLINPIPGQEKENAEFLEEKKVAKWIKPNDNIKNEFAILLNDDNIAKEMKKNIKLLATPNATKNICETILNFSSSL